MDEPKEQQETVVKPGTQIGKLAFAGVLAIPAVVISSVGCGSLLGVFAQAAIVGGAGARRPVPPTANIAMVAIISVIVLVAVAVTALVLSSLEFSEDEKRNGRIRMLLTGEQVLLSLALIGVMVGGSLNSSANSSSTTGPATQVSPHNSSPKPASGTDTPAQPGKAEGR